MKIAPVIILLTICIMLHSILFACTGIRLHAQNNDIVYARTLEWRKTLNPHIIIVPRNIAYTGTSMNDQPGMKWTTKYAFTGISIGDEPFLLDGINEWGLGAGLFSFRDDVEYGKPGSNSRHDLAPWQLITYLLSKCKNVAHVREKIKKINVLPVFYEQVNEIPPLHYVVHDTDGNCIVLEHHHNVIKVHENPLGVVTNSPNFDWHMTNLHNYLYPSFDNNKTIPTTLKKLHESHALGLPSDFSSPSRFIRAAIYSMCAHIPQTGNEGVFQAFHILNQFDIPKGAFRNNQEDYYTYTHWTSVANLTDKKYYFRTYNNQRINMIDLMNVDHEGSVIIRFIMDTTEDVNDITQLLKK